MPAHHTSHVKAVPDHAWVDAFLRDSVIYGVLGSVRKDGSPHAIPLGYVWDGSYLYLSMRSGRGGIARLRRNPVLTYLVSDESSPPRWVIVTGWAEEIPDANNHISARLMRRYKERVPGLDLDLFIQNWLSTGRVVFRIHPETFSVGDEAWFGDVVV